MEIIVVTAVQEQMVEAAVIMVMVILETLKMELPQAEELEHKDYMMVHGTAFHTQKNMVVEVK